MHITRTVLRLLAVSLGALALLAACGDSDGGSDSSDPLVEYFVENDAPRDEAECVAGELEGYDADELIAILESDEAPEDAGIIDDLFGALSTCGVE